MHIADKITKGISSSFSGSVPRCNVKIVKTDRPPVINQYGGRRSMITALSRFFNEAI